MRAPSRPSRLSGTIRAPLGGCLGLLAACTHAPATVHESELRATRAASSATSAAAPLAQTPSSASPEALVAPKAKAPEPPPAPFSGGPHAVASQNGLVVAVEANAARVGASVLENGGNAVDAAVATVFALAVTHSSAASLGGGGFALVRARGGPTLAFDFRETAPSGLDRREFEKMLARGARGKAAVGVPGVVAGLAALTARAGTRPFAELAAPALGLARKGFSLGRWEAELFRKSAPALKDDRVARRIFFPQDKEPGAGTRLVQPDLAWSLQKLVDEGADAFYRGDIAKRLAQALGPHGPSLEDLASYRCVERAPLAVPYRGYLLETMPPPSAGGVALVGSLLMFSRAPSAAAGSTAAVHYLLEVERRAQAERRLGVIDPDELAPGELERRRARWLSPGFWLGVPITEQATPSSALRPPPSEPEREGEHTTHVSVVDRNGLVVSLTTTLSASFGAKMVAAGTGIVLNNSVASLGLTGENQARPRARTTSSMAPSLLLSTSGDVAAVLGTPGGDTIPSTLAQIVTHLVDEHASLEDAIEAPRWHQAFLPDRARYEPALKASPVLAELAKQGHQLRMSTRRFGDANCIVLDGETSYGYADSREPGVAIAPGR